MRDSEKGEKKAVASPILGSDFSPQQDKGPIASLIPDQCLKDKEDSKQRLNDVLWKQWFSRFFFRGFESFEQDC